MNEAELTVLVKKYRDLATYYKAVAEHDEEPEEKYLNNKYNKKDVFYLGRVSLPTGKYLKMDVRDFFVNNNFYLDSIVTKFKLKGKTLDDTALNCLKYVASHVKYMREPKECWQIVQETIERNAGDCEDGAILLANLLIAAGVPYWRVRLNAGLVKALNNKMTGHAYVSYCRETDNEFVVLDWCFYYNNKPIKDRKKHFEERDYYDVWFSCNQKYSFVGKMNSPKTFTASNLKVSL